METNAGFRRYLQDELVKRAKKNPSFSIRAFARQLQVEPSALAQILGEKRKLTDRMCERLAARLGLSPRKVQTLMKRELVGAEDSFRGFKRIQEDAFRVIADWYYYAILELTRTVDFQGNINWIAQTLGLSTAEAHTAVERLKRLGYLKINEQGAWVDAMGSAQNLGNEYSAPAFREHQKQLLKKAIEAIDQVDYAERVQSSMVLSGSRERVAEAKQRILNFIEELDEFMKSGSSREEVYTISVSLFPISKNKTSKKRSQS